jgi:hemerythrin superfamily protein
MTVVSDAIKQDHRELEDYYSHIVNSTDKDEQTRYRNAFAWELARHSIAEEIVVYPELEKNVSGGNEIAEKDRAEHQKVCLCP